MSNSHANIFTVFLLYPIDAIDRPGLATLPPPGAIEKLAKEDPRRARTGQVLDDRIAAKRTELRKGTKKAKAKAATAATAADPAEGKAGGGEELEDGAAPAAGDSMDEDEDGDGGVEDESVAAEEDGKGAEQGGAEVADDDDDDDDGMEEEEAQEGLEEDNLRELLAGGRGKVCIYAAWGFVAGVWRRALYARVACPMKFRWHTHGLVCIFVVRSGSRDDEKRHRPGDTATILR